MSWGIEGLYNVPFMQSMTRRMKNNPARQRRELLERMHLRVLTELCANRFEWKGLPDEIDPRFLEIVLFQNALAVFFEHPDYEKYMVLRGSPAGRLNPEDNPVGFQVTGNGMISMTLRRSDCVPIWSNYVRVPDLDIVYIYASKMADIDMSIEINAKQARRTRVTFADENQRLSIDNIVRQIDEGQPLIRLKNTNPGERLDEMIKTIDMGVDPDTIINLHILRTRLWGECMGLLGINNANQDKKERLVASEVSANDEQVSAMRNVNLNARQQAAKQISKKYGLDVTVDYRNDGGSLGAVGILDEGLDEGSPVGE